MKTITRFTLFTMFCLLSSSAFTQDEVKPTPPPPPVSDAEAKQAVEFFEAGRKLFFQGKYLDSVEKLQQAAETDPAKTSYKMLLAKAHRYAKQGERATAVLEQIIKTNPDHVEAGIQLAELLTPSKEPDRVIGVLKPLLKYKHDYPLYHLLAEAYYAKEDFDNAREHFEEAVKLNPRSGEDQYQLGNIYLAQKRFAKAAAAYEKAGELDVSSGVYHFKLASVYFNLHNNLGRITVAEVLGGKVGEINNEFFLLDTVPGKKDLFYVCSPRSAVFQSAKAIAMGIDVFDIHFLQANVWLAARRFPRADAIYKKLQETVKDADAGLYWYQWSQAALGLGNLDAYLARLNKAIEADEEVYKSTLTDALVVVANRYHQRGDSGKYMEFLGQAVENNPLSPSLHLTLGDAHWLANQRPQAIEQYKLVLELEPDHTERVRLLNRIRARVKTSPKVSAR